MSAQDLVCGEPANVTPDAFIAKWKGATLTERAAAQSHFIDLCRMLDEPAPTDADPKGEWYAFERGATKASGGEGWADVWKRGHFGWEYKGKRKDLDAALGQLKMYALALENPPLLVVCDMERFRVVTNWTATVSKTHEFTLDDLRNAETRRLLKWVLSDPEKLRPGLTRQTLTERAAGGFADLATSLRARGHEPHAVAHFINRLVFCMFAEDVDMLPGRMFGRMLEHAAAAPADFPTHARTLFAAMRTGGVVGFERVKWFNGGLFDDDEALPLTKEEIDTVRAVARLDWSEIDPSIFGTLFERGLDPEKRGQLGAHYTDRAKIMMIVEPVVMRPLLDEWERAKADIAARLAKAEETGAEAKRTRGRAGAAKAGAATKLRNEAEAIYQAFLARVRAFRVLDPACGSGNFLYLALQALKDIEHRAGLDAEVLGLHRALPEVGPEAVRGIEVNPYAAELARVTVWIGEIQWMRRNGYSASENPILRPLDTIEDRDAVLNPDGTEAEWPAADAIIGNPPFIGGKLMRTSLGDATVERLFATYEGRVPAEADFVMYWIAKAWERVSAGSSRAGLVATNSIRGGANRRVVDGPAAAGAIFEAWSDEPWVVEGADVRVSLICLRPPGVMGAVRLDGAEVPRINADLTATAHDLTTARRLAANAGVSFMGDTKGGAFDVAGEVARVWLTLPTNANGRPNADVLRPWVNGRDVTRRGADKWIIDFGWTMTEAEAAFYEAPFAHVETKVKPVRAKNRRPSYRRNWWRHVEPRPAMWAALRGLRRYIATPRNGRNRVFVWLDPAVCPDCQIIAIARDDDTTFGILQSRFHEVWSLGLCSWLGVGNDPRYTPSTTFETFPFPDGLTPDLPPAAYTSNPHAVAIADAARRLVEARDRWLNPPELVRRELEAATGFPDRLRPVDASAEAELKKRTLTILYRSPPTWLVNAHAALDAAVAAAYGWPASVSDDELLARLLELNLSRSATTEPPPDEGSEDEEEAA